METEQANIKLTLLLFLLFLAAMSLTSCASKPKIWYDKYGILHREEVDVNEVTWVKVVFSYSELSSGCVRLRNIYLDGTSGVDWNLKFETAKMGGSHVVKEYYNGVSDTMGIAFDCSKSSHYSNVQRLQRVARYNSALGELERRTYENNKEKKSKLPSIPTLDE